MSTLGRIAALRLGSRELRRRSEALWKRGEFTESRALLDAAKDLDGLRVAVDRREFDEDREEPGA